MNNLDADSLIRAGREVREPFALSLVMPDGDQAELMVRKILRLLPGKRIVAVAELGDRQVLVKIFIGRSSGRYMRREASGACAIEDAGVLTASLEWQARIKSASGHVLAFEYIDSASNLSDVWRRSKSIAEKQQLIGRVIPVLAALHEGGVVQNDIHPENFLFRNNRIYTIDGGDVTRRGRAPLPEAKSLENLALFFAQFNAKYDHLLPELLEQYRLTRAWPVEHIRAQVLSDLVSRKRSERKSDYIGKAFRECTKFRCESSFSRFLVCERKFDTTEMRQLLDNIDSHMASGRLLKDGNSATVALVDGPNGKLVIKRYNIKSLTHQLSRAFRKSRAWVSWANAYRLEFLGISTVKPVALVEERLGPLRGRAYFISQYIEGPDATVLPEKDNPVSEIVSIVEILKDLSAAGVTHGDLKASNFLLGSEGPVIIDLDSMREHKDPIEKDKAEKKDLARFMRNWESIPQVQQQFAELLS